MRRRVLVVALVAVAVSLVTASVAWADTITPMCTTAQGTQPCASGWYTTPVLQLSWMWTAGGTPSNCNESAYQSDSVATVSCTVSWGQTGSTAYYTIQVETSSPTAAVGPSRAADSAGWYNHPVTGAISAGAYSGIASCARTTYSGPNTTSATVSGTCVDNAGKSVTVTSAPFAYDASPPALTTAANPGDQNVALSWQAGGDLAPITSIAVARSVGSAADALVYRGTGTGFDDTNLKDGVQYTYTITARDQAGNVAVSTVTATPGPRLLGPAPHAHLTTPPMLSWTPVLGASYYNVQLYRADPRKVLSLWPDNAGLQLKRTWRFQGRRYRLKPGRYRWYVWPGFGKRAAGRYGRMIGSGAFVIVR